MSRTSISVLVAAVIVAALFYIGSPPSEESRQSAAPTPTLTDERLRKDQEAEVAATTKAAELDRRKQAKAVNFVRVYDRKDEKRGHVLEGTVTNSASFSVYNVQVCVEENCRSTLPSTLPP